MAAMTAYLSSLLALGKRPSAFVPIAMSVAALLMVLASIAVSGVVRETDEGGVAHLWQIHVGGIARVGLRDRGGLVAVDHDARRVAAALVRVTQLDAPAAHQRRLVHAEGVLERTRQLARRHGAHGRLVGAHGGLHELAHPAPMARRDE